MLKRSLTLCVGIAVLSSPLLASFKESLVVDVGFGERSVTLGKATETTAKNLLGNRKATTTVTPVGTVTRLAHSVPTVVFNASGKLSLKKDSALGFKIGLQAVIPDSTKHTIYDGQSTTGTVTLQASRPRLVLADGDPLSSEAAPGGTIGTNYLDNSVEVAEPATVGISSITAGNRLCTVEHQPAYGASIKYSFGKDEYGLAVGLATLRSADKYIYTCEEPPAGGADTGVYDSSDATFGDNFQIGTATTEDGNDTNDDETLHQYVSNTALVNSSAYTDRVTKNYTALAGTALEYNDTVHWTGIVGEATTALHKHLVAKSGFGYYWRQFDKSNGDTLSAPLFVAPTNATMVTAYIGVGYTTMSQ